MDKRELLETLEDMGYDFRSSNETSEDVENDTRSLADIPDDEIDWGGVYMVANNEGFKYIEKDDLWQ